MSLEPIALTYILPGPCQDDERLHVKFGLFMHLLVATMTSVVDDYHVFHAYGNIVYCFINNALPFLSFHWLLNC